MDKPAEHLTREKQFRVRVLIGAICYSLHIEQTTAVLAGFGAGGETKSQESVFHQQASEKAPDVQPFMRRSGPSRVVSAEHLVSRQKHREGWYDLHYLLGSFI